MKTKDLMTLALRVVAVIIGVYACADLVNVVSFLILGFHWMKSTNSELTSIGGYTVILWSIPMIVALLLWWLAPRLARLACRKFDPKVDLSGMDVERLTHGAFVVVGVWILVFGVINLARIGVNELSVTTNPKWVGGALFPWDYFADYVLRCLIGTVLILGGRNLSRIFLHLRTAGTEKS